MARHLYAPLFVQLAGTASPAPSLPFTVWTDLLAGTNVTSQIVGPDGVSVYQAVTDTQGNIAPFRGPDGYVGNLFVDTGASYRFELDSPTLLDYLVANVGVGGSGGGVTDHGALSGLADDDHIQYLTATRGDARYFTQAQTNSAISSADTAASAADRDRANHSGTQTASTISDFASAAQAVTGTGSAYDSGVLHKALAETVTGVKTFSVSPVVPTPVNPTDAANRAFVLANTGGGTTSPGSSVQRFEIAASSLSPWPSGGTEAQKLAAVNTNSATVRTALINHPGMNVVLDPSQPWPLQVDINEFTDTSFAAGQDYILSGPAMLVRGTRTSNTDTSTSRIQPRPVLAITRKAGSNVFVPTNLRNNVQVGPNSPNTGSVFTSVCSGFDVTSGAAQFKAGQVWHLCSQDGYAWSSRAGYTNVWQAAMFPVAGIMLTITGLSYTALAAAAPQTPSISSIERRTIVGVTSGAVALVQGDITGTSQVVVNSVSKDFSVGETIRDQATNAVLGTLASTTVIMSGTLNTPYTTTPQMRLVTRSRVDVSGLSVTVDADVDEAVPSWNRSDVMALTGCTDVNLDGAKASGGYLAGIMLRSCWNVRGNVDLRGLANHALEEADSTLHLSPSGMPVEGAYGYGVRLLGATQNFGIGINIEYGRHAQTTNGIGGSWNLDSRTGSTSGSVNLCTNFWNHGPGGRKGYFTGKAAHMYGTGWDTHEGAEDIVWINPVVVDPISAARSTTSPDGATFRGFNLTLINPYFTGVRIGIAEQGIALGAGGLVWTNRVIGGYVQAQCYGYAQTEDADFDVESRFVIDGTTFRGDTNLASSTYAQAGLMLRRGNTRTKNVRIEAINDRMVRHTSFPGTGSTGVGRVIHEDITLDWTDSTASRAFSFEADYASVEINGAHAYVNPVGGSQRPLYWFVNQAGNTPIRYKNLMATSLSSTTATPSVTPSITAGNPTFTGLDTSGGGGTQVSVDGASVATLDISSTPVVQVLTIGADIAGPTGATTISNLSQFQTSLAAGAYVVEAQLFYQQSVISAGALRFGLGGPGSAGASITNVLVDQNTTATAKSAGFVNVLGTAGDTVVTTAGTANVVGLSAGVAAATLPIQIKGRLLVTTGGTLGLVWGQSNGATSVATLKAGSYISFTKVG